MIEIKQTQRLLCLSLTSISLGIFNLWFWIVPQDFELEVNQTKVDESTSHKRKYNL